jgi:hypothetical protein
VTVHRKIAECSDNPQTCERAPDPFLKTKDAVIDAISNFSRNQISGWQDFNAGCVTVVLLKDVHLK